jgi:hypothetical protein
VSGARFRARCPNMWEPPSTSQCHLRSWVGDGSTFTHVGVVRLETDPRAGGG